MIQAINLIIQFVFILAVAPLAVGLVKFIKARLQGRKGASPFLIYINLATLLKKEMVIPSAASWVFRVAPFVVLASSLFLAFLIPTIFHVGAFSWLGDFLIISGILMVGSIFLVMGGLDSGSAFGGMGASREMTIATILEPTMILVFSAFGFAAHSFTIDGMMMDNLILTSPYLLLSMAALVMLALGENARYPVDNPATHLELTMVHEAMILEYSGPYLAMMEYASAIKLTVFMFLISNFVFPGTLMSLNAGFLGVASSILLAVVKIVIVTFLLAVLESTIVKMRFYRMHEYASVSFLAAFFGMVAAVLSQKIGLLINYTTFFTALTILFAVFAFGNLRIGPVLRYYVFSSLSIAGIAISLGIYGIEKASHMFFFAIITILIKAVCVPILIKYAVNRDKRINLFQTFVRPASGYLLAGVIIAIAFFVTTRIPLVKEAVWTSILFASIALSMLGIMKMVIIRNIYSQIVGLLILENGLALFTLVTVKILPFVIELGIFSITLVSVFILAKLSASIKELYDSTDTEELRNLID